MQRRIRTCEHRINVPYSNPFWTGLLVFIVELFFRYYLYTLIAYNFPAITRFVAGKMDFHNPPSVILPPAVPLPHNILSLPNYPNMLPFFYPSYISNSYISMEKRCHSCCFCAQNTSAKRDPMHVFYPAAQSLPGKIRPPDRSLLRWTPLPESSERSLLLLPCLFSFSYGTRTTSSSFASSNACFQESGI